MDYLPQTVTVSTHAVPVQQATATVYVSPTGVPDISGQWVWTGGSAALYQDGLAVTGSLLWQGSSYAVNGTLNGFVFSGAMTSGGNSYGFNVTLQPDARSWAGNSAVYGSWNATFQPGVIIRMTPLDTAILKAGTQRTYSAQVGGTRDKGLVWSATAGTIVDGVYTATTGTSYGLQTIRVAAHGDPSQTVSAKVYVTPTGYLDVSGKWDSAVGSAIVFQEGTTLWGTLSLNDVAYTLTGTLNGYMIAWKLQQAEGGTMVSLPTLLAEDGKSWVGSNDLFGGLWNATWSPGMFLTLVPNADPVYMKASFQHAFKAVSAGSTDKTIAWSVVEGAGGGTFTANGVYTSPAVLGTYHVMATACDGITTAVNEVDVIVDPGQRINVVVTPSNLELGTSGTTTFSAVVEGTTNPGVTWSCSGGVIDPATGAYVAPASPGSFTITATSIVDTTAFGSATLTVRATVGQDRAFTYDLNGNMLSDGDKTYEWDGENRLLAVNILATGHRSEFAYDGLGRRVAITERDPDGNGNATVTSDRKYLWDGVEIAEERNTTGAVVQKQFFSQGFVDNDGTSLFYTRDHLGSVRELTDNAQVVRARYDYDPYGRMAKIQGDRDTVFAYADYFYHAASGLNLTIYRAYDSNFARWISRDPIGEVGGINLFEFVLNNPINYIDTTGLCKEKLECMSKIVAEHFATVERILIDLQNALNREGNIYIGEMFALGVTLAGLIYAVTQTAGVALVFAYGLIAAVLVQMTTTTARHNDSIQSINAGHKKELNDEDNALPERLKTCKCPCGDE
jgi:RHS repeat-associated protein